MVIRASIIQLVFCSMEGIRSICFTKVLFVKCRISYYCICFSICSFLTKSSLVLWFMQQCSWVMLVKVYFLWYWEFLLDLVLTIIFLGFIYLVACYLTISFFWFNVFVCCFSSVFVCIGAITCMYIHSKWTTLFKFIILIVICCYLLLTLKKIKKKIGKKIQNIKRYIGKKAYKIVQVGGERLKWQVKMLNDQNV